MIVSCKRKDLIQEITHFPNSAREFLCTLDSISKNLVEKLFTLNENQLKKFTYITQVFLLSY